MGRGAMFVHRVGRSRSVDACPLRASRRASNVSRPPGICPRPARHAKYKTSARIGPFVAFQAESGVSDDDGTRGGRRATSMRPSPTASTARDAGIFGRTSSACVPTVDLTWTRPIAPRPPASSHRRRPSNACHQTSRSRPAVVRAEAERDGCSGPIACRFDRVGCRGPYHWVAPRSLRSSRRSRCC